MSELTDWLMQSESPSIRYLTSRHLLNKDDPALRAEIMQTDPVKTILKGQSARGSWAHELSFYTPKYTASHWSMTLLTELAADPTDERMLRGVEAVLTDTAQMAEATFAPEHQDWVCLWGNILRYVGYCGRMDDPRAQRILELVDLAAGKRGWGCRFNGELACAWGAIRALWGLAALPTRTPAIDASIQSGLTFLFDSTYSLIKADFPTSGKPHKLWSGVNAFLFYQADILLTLRLAAELHQLDHPQVQAALDWLEARRGSNGRWRGASPYRRMTWKNLSTSAEWVSLHAAVVLKQAGRVH